MPLCVRDARSRRGSVDSADECAAETWLQHPSDVSCDYLSVTYIPDLAPYDYYHGAPEALAVGWLDSSMPFETGACPQEARDRLVQLAEQPVRLMRGYHYCQFCEADAPPARRLREDIRLNEAPDVAHGNGEIWLTTPDGTNYAAPALIGHYIDAHEYLPPAAFIDAARLGAVAPDLS